MTARPPKSEASKDAAKAATDNAAKAATDNAAKAAADNAAKAAATARASKGSVHEAIGKLIGDDAVAQQGSAEKHAGTEAVSNAKTSPRR